MPLPSGSGILRAAGPPVRRPAPPHPAPRQPSLGPTTLFPSLLPVMADDWLDCPTLGPGWKRREASRKSGATCGRTDTYYQSPTGERIRSKAELTRFLGPDCDLSCFDFKRGVLQYLPTKASSQKKKRPARLENRPREPPGAPAAKVSKASPKWCEKCGARMSGDSARRQRLRFLCKGCRAQRNAFNREQRMFKRVGCGDCRACRLTEDCGACPACVGQLSQPGGPQLPRSQCVQRRCLKIVNKTFGCGLCSGCQTKEDCGTCRICERRGRPGLKRRWKCLQRRCLRNQIKKKPRGLAARKHPGRRRRGPALPLLPPSHPPAEAGGPSGLSGDAQHYSSRRQNRHCGACVACLRRVDCGQCDFCQDKPKFGGCNQKRQKCRWRQCLQFAMKRLLPSARWDSPAVEGAAAPLCWPRRRKGALLNRACQPGWPKSGGLCGQRLVSEALGSGLEDNERPGLGAPVKQEVEGYEAQTSGAAASPSPGGSSPGFSSKGANPVQLQHSVKQEGEAEAAAGTPVIMEIYSLSGAIPTAAAGPCGELDGVLQEFLMELNELPLPAHWEVLPPTGPELCITQRSPLSTVAAAVIHIQAGLYFHVVVQDVPVPPAHELYSAHPLRLTTVDEVVELICDLEAYCLCPGWPDGSRSPDCDVLVYEGFCQACSLGEQQ
ncbi:methyl-CpG-binding domain protein 1-like isoform X1 [Gracilinanus agilis]|uniref:methyl-CpG-binding domain protein 1-like isoform X1 n=1 Tax=Gracilinanus agilis TaxID=191870 RepID=UPI001CFC6F86|nr:methyl-CpG-binding domain protein 1-like isoform X1 [Gracilinanus agilis]